MNKNLICRHFTLCLLLVLCASVAIQAQQGTASYNATLEGYAYPFPVKRFGLELEGGHYSMAYMDVAPAKADSSAHTVVLFHGKNFMGAYWERTIRFLSQNGYRVVVPDQVGFGKSDKPSIQYTFHQLAQNTRQLLQAIGVHKAVVVGHSMGGMLAARFALMYPDFTARLVLENPIGLEDYRPFVPFRTMQALYQEELQRSAESIRKYHGTYYTSWQPAYEEWVRIPAAQLGGADYPKVAKAAALTYSMIYQQPVIYEFAQIKVPTLLVIGQEDRTIVGKGYIQDQQTLKAHGQYPALGKQAAAAIPGAELVEFKNVGHIPHLEAPQKFHKALLEFLGR
ncbi:alpha/beta fold hydrolase [Pontibacter beigongshangensis]|uniref:alpha/beta fold hydrolase n=1 Tax=Pontibacter beigongshangensis TaxID=2574733 RepID=UPI00164EDE9A|nr:alpha/beta hydrolase [Pontibacter beigongshangensis]